MQYVFKLAQISLFFKNAYYSIIWHFDNTNTVKNKLILQMYNFGSFSQWACITITALPL